MITKSYLGYRYAVLKNTPYFGSYLSSSQTDPKRAPIMNRVIQQECSSCEGAFYMLEVGAWAGRSSRIWGEAIKKYTGGKGFLVSVDIWEPFVPKDGHATYLPWMQKALGDGKVHRLFLHNIAVLGLVDVVRSYKGPSEEILPTLKDNFFNVVYIDANHSYSNAINDIKHGARLTAEGGVLCGDDLEYQMSEIDEPF